MSDDKDIHTAPTLPNQQAQQAPLPPSPRRQPVTNIELLDAIERMNAETRRDIGDLRRETRDTRNEVGEMRLEQRAQRQQLETHARDIDELRREARGRSDGPRYRGKMPSLTSETRGDLDGALSSDDRLQRAEVEIIKAKAAWWKQAAAVVAIIVPVLAAGLGILDRLVSARLDHVQDSARRGAAEAVERAPPKILPVAVPAPLQSTGTE